jgi:sugar lactone lactonase YvrE
VKRILISIVAVLALAAGATVASARSGHDHGGKGAKERLFTLKPDPAGNPEGIAFDKRSKAFYVSITVGGDIYRGSLKSDTVEPFIEGEGSSVGVKVKRGKLYVAGGSSGAIKVYDLATKALVAKFDTGADPGFLNDLVVTRGGDVYVTDSIRETLWHVTADQVEAGSGTPQALDVSEIPYEAGQFNVNGIVAKSSNKLVVVDSNSGKLFRIKLGDEGDSIDSIDEITGATVPGGDGLLLDKGKLVVVQGAAEQLAFLKLERGAREAKLKRTQTSEKLVGPSTVDAAKGLYLVVDADSATDTKPFKVAGLPRKAKHGHHDDHGHDRGDHQGNGHGDDDRDHDDHSGSGHGDDD